MDCVLRSQEGIKWYLGKCFLTQEFYVCFYIPCWDMECSALLSCETVDPKLYSLPLCLVQPFSGCCSKLNLWRRCTPFILRTRNKSRVLTGSMLSDELNTFMKELPTIYWQCLSFFFFIVIVLVLLVWLDLLDFPRNFSAVVVKVLTLDLLNFYVV